MTTKKINALLIRLFYGLIVLLTATLTGYRLKIWIKDYMSLSSKFYVSSVIQKNGKDLVYPTISICNINPAKGSLLLSNSYKTGAPQDYELFVDSINGRVNQEVSVDRLKRPFFQILDTSSHRLQDMLKYCNVGKKKCDHINFTKSLLPSGSCYTYNGKITADHDITLALDPEISEYLIPNAGYAGFRILVHSMNEPLWAALPSSMFIGPNFHTHIRVNEIEKNYHRHCIKHDYWILCMHQCLEKSIFKLCHCYLMGENSCTLSHVMACGLNLGNIIEYVLPENCACTKRCTETKYKFESITQSFKSKVFSMFMAPWSREGVQDRHPKNGKLIQLWAYLREANITAFEELRELSIYLEKLFYFVNDLEENLLIFRKKWQKKSLNKCRQKRSEFRKSHEIFRTGMDFIKFVKSTELFKNLPDTPFGLIHIHLVNLFFVGYVDKLRKIESFTEVSSFITELSIFSPTIDSTCGPSEKTNEKKFSANSNVKDDMKWSELSAKLEKLFLYFGQEFKKFKKKFEETVKYNTNIIQAISNLSFQAMKVEDDKTTVTVTVQLLISDNFGYHLESAQNLYDPHLAIVDIVMSGLVIAFVFLTLTNKCLKLKLETFSSKACGVQVHKEATIQNNLSHGTFEKNWNHNQRDSIHSREMDSPVTTFQLI